jgi:hypothetical protein
MTKYNLKDKSVVVVALARDCEELVESELNVLQKATSSFGSVFWLIIESDSSDSTVEKLKLCKSNIDNFRYISLGDLSEGMPLRTQRIAYCRNQYLKEVNNNSIYIDVDYVIVADIDGMNNLLTSNALQSCWINSNWDVCTANQAGPYYDIWALRHKDWCPGDCWNEFNFLQDHGSSYKDALFSAVHSRMISISRDASWIEVDSSFGGTAIYKKRILENVKYVGLGKDGSEVCEHVHLHKKIKKLGGRIYINPKFINTGVTEHTQNFRFHQRIKIFIVSIFKRYN